jgi:hypothetical protein
MIIATASARAFDMKPPLLLKWDKVQAHTNLITAAAHVKSCKCMLLKALLKRQPRFDAAKTCCSAAPPPAAAAPLVMPSPAPQVGMYQPIFSNKNTSNPWLSPPTFKCNVV